MKECWETDNYIRSLQNCARFPARSLCRAIPAAHGAARSLRTGRAARKAGQAAAREAQFTRIAMRTLTDGARQSAASVREFNVATEHLRDAVGGLRGEIARFQVSE